MESVRTMVLLLAAITGGAALTAETNSPALFPFVLPWDDASPGTANASAWLDAPAGQHGFVVAKDGHFYTGPQRIRFFGVNVCFAAAFPKHEDADKVAARLAKFGVNCVRFHHMDSQEFPGGIRARGVKNTRDLDPEALDRLDYFIAQLKRRGIYANLNLLVSRPFNAADGLPSEIESLGWKERHVVGFFHQPELELQKEYARKLLTHRNPHTGLTYAEDPAVAFVEINNENGLIQAWLGGEVDRLPAVFLSDLQRQWNGWLKNRHGTTAQLRTAWKVKEEPLGTEMLVNGDFAGGTAPWVLEQHQGAAATAVVETVAPSAGEGSGSRPTATESRSGPGNGHAGLRHAEAATSAQAGAWPSNAVRIVVTKLGPAGWHVQFNQPGLKARAEQPYTLTFRAKADPPGDIIVGLMQAHDPWAGLGFSTAVNLGTDWRQYRFTFPAGQADDNARINFGDLGRRLGTYWLADVSLRPGGVVGLSKSEQVEDGTVPVFLKGHWGERTVEGQRDWMRFLWETEDRYWQAMYRFLKDDLKVRAVVMGTIVGCSTPNLMAKFDAVDTHAYWQHPQFPGRPWDPDNWIVPNKTMVNERGGTLPGLALRRVLGKPHCVTEYNHPAPNTYSSEGFLLLAAYAALQDWDAIFAFSYCHRRDDWDTRRIPNFFDIDQHPAKMATIIPAVAMFGRGDVRSARGQFVVAMDRDKELDLLRASHAWGLVDASRVGVPGEAALMERVAVATQGTRPPSAPVPVQAAGDRLASDTGELVWDVSEKGRGVVTVNAARSKAVIGFGAGKRFELGGIVIEPGDTRQNGWSAVTVTELQPGRWLVTAIGYTENTAMGWKTADQTSVGRAWGQAPSLVEGVPATVTLPAAANRVRAWALDERGQRRAELPAHAGGGRATLALGPQHQTLWYEVDAR